ncbi:MAG: hypothetical protein A3J48_03050 [Candidatus Doudnabacteria bacterium RIFCSPHIGHO2_02_FULL_46_11]|uniref:Uncharacterized protein n=1 Tax=Candidatus Doudnabacteria bacterium RIFCSPHIGHO2_02_FULL_46_11 TaxID=1817832 RepID=A0A1F5P5L6_9BACT|nr:MAG: hypothetical protein A3J48_03050 [Candidatus Doudnabacteria bacterium RIFCSPHIGHO2_02_FULL_46_11]
MVKIITPLIIVVLVGTSVYLLGRSKMDSVSETEKSGDNSLEQISDANTSSASPDAQTDQISSQLLAEITAEEQALADQEEDSTLATSDSTDLNNLGASYDENKF